MRKKQNFENSKGPLKGAAPKVSKKVWKTYQEQIQLQKKKLALNMKGSVVPGAHIPSDLVVSVEDIPLPSGFTYVILPLEPPPLDIGHDQVTSLSSDFSYSQCS